MSFWIIGNPNPTLIWYQTGVLEVIIDNSYSVNSTGVVRNELNLRKLDRKDYRSRLTCRASSNALYEPIDKTVIIDMNCEFWDQVIWKYTEFSFS